MAVSFPRRFPVPSPPFNNLHLFCKLSIVSVHLFPPLYRHQVSLPFFRHREPTGERSLPHLGGPRFFSFSFSFFFFYLTWPTTWVRAYRHYSFFFERSMIVPYPSLPLFSIDMVLGIRLLPLYFLACRFRLPSFPNLSLFLQPKSNRSEHFFLISTVSKLLTQQFSSALDLLSLFRLACGGTRTLSKQSTLPVENRG